MFLPCVSVCHSLRGPTCKADRAGAVLSISQVQTRGARAKLSLPIGSGSFLDQAFRFCLSAASPVHVALLCHPLWLLYLLLSGKEEETPFLLHSL